MLLLFFILLIIPKSFELSTANNGPVVRTRQGSIKGRTLLSSNGRRYNAFTAIPYALPPVGERRFKPAEAYPPQSDIYDATGSHNNCPQMSIFREGNPATGNEDCLYLNIYTPYLPQGDTPNLRSRALPVMILLFKDYFTFGNANFESVNPSHFMNSDIVLAVPNFRIGFLGFASTNDSVLPGNLALKDQNFAIMWVRDNIAAFGGQPNNITLFGQSTGAASAHLQTLSPLSNPYIKAAILQSGNALSPWVLSRPSEGITNTKTLAAFFNCPISDSLQMIQCLRKVSSDDIVYATRGLFYQNPIYPIMPFRPVIEPKVEGAFLTEDPEDIIRSGRAKDIAYIMGITSEDGAIRSAGVFGTTWMVDSLNTNFDRMFPISLFYDTAGDPAYVNRRLRNLYFNNAEIVNNERFRSNMTNLFTHRHYLHSTMKSLILHRRTQRKPLYYYIYSYQAINISTTVHFDPAYRYGSSHGDELILMFPLEAQYLFTPTTEDLQVTRVLIETWTSFATNLQPIASQIPNKWTPIQNRDLNYYFIIDGSNAIMLPENQWRYYQFWSNVDGV